MSGPCRRASVRRSEPTTSSRTIAAIVEGDRLPAAGDLLYADTSALLKLLVEERESDALADALSAWRPVLVSSELTLTELPRAGSRVGVSPDAVQAVLDGLDLLALDAPLLRRAGRLPGTSLRSAHAIHLVSAIDLAAPSFLTYDARQAEAAAAVGMAVLSPGRDGS